MGNLLAKGEGYRTYLVGFVLLMNMFYTLVTGDAVPTFDNPGSAAPGVAEVGGGLGAGLMTVRSAISTLTKRLDTVLAAATPTEPKQP